MKKESVLRLDLLTAHLTAQAVAKVEIKEITIPPGGKGARHFHPCPVVGYIVSGAVMFQIERSSAQIIQEGSAFYEPKNTTILHFDNASTTESLTFIAFYLLEGDEEMIKMLDEEMKVTKAEDMVEEIASERYVQGLTKWKVLNRNHEVHLSEVTFQPMARTHWHSHPETQLLLANHGKGFVQMQNGPLSTMMPGDVVSIPAHQIHWHGAGPDEYFVHTAIQMKNDCADVFEPLLDDLYLKCFERP